MRNRRIKTQVTPHPGINDPVELGGWLQGKETYLWLGEPGGRCRGILDGAKLLRLAKAIVRQFEATP